MATIRSDGALRKPTAQASSGPSATTDARFESPGTAGSANERQRLPFQCQATLPTIQASLADAAEISESSGTEYPMMNPGEETPATTPGCTGGA